VSVRIKICGITRPEDALAVRSAGAEALGVVFWKGSPRCVTAEQARAILEPLQGQEACEPTGVFVNAAAGEVRDTMATAGLRRAQLHGDETPRYAADLGVPWYRVFRVPEGADPLALVETIREFDAERFMLDAGDSARPGGTGRVVDWKLAAKIAMHLALKGRPRLILAGGLTPDNVAEAIRLVRPWQVDVSSGVESAPGIKDAGKIGRFVQAVRGVT
jgi:phosphoribosylanthranilate isomerase